MTGLVSTARISSFFTPLKGGPELSFTARIEGALFHRAASASKKGSQAPLQIPQPPLT